MEKDLLKALGTTGASLVILWLFAKELIINSSPLSAELTFVLLAIILFIFFILAFKLMSGNKVSRDSSVTIGAEGYNSGKINTGDVGISKKESSRDSSVSVDGRNTNDISTGDSSS